MSSRLPTILIAVLASGLIAAGCGGGGEEQGTTPPAGTPTTTEEAKQQGKAQCLEQARKLEGEARKTAEAACESIESGDTTAVKDAVREQCLNAAKDIPDPTARKTAEEQCEKGTQ